MPDNLIPDDAFDTASLRRRVLDAWAASPARFREDANAEEDYALGGYRDRVVVELAQNAADAAARASVPGRLRLTLRADGTLTADNTGAPLDAAGVEGISTLRASAKRDDDPGRTVGRFGVGFAAVVAVCDEPRMVSRTGAVQWSRAQSHDLVTGIPALADELAARGGNVPVLRLPFPAPLQGPDAAPPHGPGPAFDTTVVLPLRDADAVALAGRLLAQTGAELLLALPALAEVTVEADGSRRTLAAVRDGDTVTISETTTPLPNAPANSPAGHHTVT
ncbi:MAG: molecular chaperone Hsp90, partial [Actinomycetia bacterium]|nr:molecular chaperone Hsp90 [Actinomycetes bacterium]